MNSTPLLFLCLGGFVFLNTFANAQQFLACPVEELLTCFSPIEGKTFCESNTTNFNNVTIEAPFPLGKVKLIAAREDDQSCEYSFNNGAQGFRLKKTGEKCTAVNTPIPGFNCL